MAIPSFLWTLTRLTIWRFLPPSFLWRPTRLTRWLPDAATSTPDQPVPATSRHCNASCWGNLVSPGQNFFAAKEWILWRLWEWPVRTTFPQTARNFSLQLQTGQQSAILQKLTLSTLSTEKGTNIQYSSFYRPTSCWTSRRTPELGDRCEKL